MSDHELEPRERGVISTAPAETFSASQEAEDEAEGRLPLSEFAFRLGLLIGALLFFHESVGPFSSRGMFGLAGLLLSMLIVLTLAMKWRVLGDWRQKLQLCLYTALVFVLAYPVSAALSPTLGATALPAGIEQPLAQFFSGVSAVPGMAALLDFLRGILSFLFLLLTIIILVLGSVDSRRGGVLVIGIFLTGVCLFFHPAIETIVAFCLLGTFFFNQWERPLLVAPKIRSHLKPIQIEYLRELLRQGTLSTGETKIFLDNNPTHFSELLDLKLVDYDSIAREILPGHRLLHDPAAAALEAGFAFFRRCIWIMIGITYVLLPDLIPGPIDDLVVLAITTGAGVRFMSLFKGEGAGRTIRRDR